MMRYPARRYSSPKDITMKFLLFALIIIIMLWAALIAVADIVISAI